MNGDWRRYFEWWVETYKGGILVVVAPLLIPIGLVVSVAGAVGTDAEIFGLGVLFLACGALAVFAPAWLRRESKPWDERRDRDSHDSPPWSSR